MLNSTFFSSKYKEEQMIIIATLTVIILVGIDQLTKLWAVATLAAGNGTMSGMTDIQLWPNVFHLHYTPNTGAAWGMLSGKQGILIIITSIIIIGLIIYIRTLPQTKWGNWGRVAFILIISGAIGNLIDRVCLGYVRDFLYFILINFPIFNIADILVVVGVGLLMIVLLFGDLEDKKKLEK